MSDHESVVRRLREANPVISLAALHEEELEALRSLLDRRRGKMTATSTPSGTAPHWRRPALVLGMAFVLTLAVVGTVLLLARGGQEAPVIATTTTPLPTTTPAPTTTTEAPTTTAAPFVPPGLAMTWTQAPTQDAFGLNDAISTVIEGGPGLIAVGCVLDTSRGETEMGPADAAVWVSADGLTWERVSDAEVFGGADSQKINDVVRGPNGYVAVGWGADPAIWFSPDGIEWEQASGQVPGLDSVIADADGYLALGEGFWRSPDGRTWARIDEHGFSPNWVEAMMGNTMWSVVALPDGYGFVADGDGDYYYGADTLF
ncbi:MAG: hypothetical protein JW785_02965, partial [Acidimicrobiia bacterium]|nr:hypothetical protein [Acidimicrobiia bacterium]